MGVTSMRSQRLRKVRDVLLDGEPHSTRDILQATGVCAINSAVNELRLNGAKIICERHTVDGAQRFFYTMLTPPVDVSPDDQPLDFQDDT